MTPTSLTTHRIAGALGAEVRGVDLAKPLDDDQFAELNQALLEHQVIFLRHQHAFDDAAHLAFAERFGELSIYPLDRGASKSWSLLGAEEELRWRIVPERIAPTSVGSERLNGGRVETWPTVRP